MMDAAAKRELLKEKIASRGSMIISFSGGVDSGLLAVIAREVLGSKSRCVFLDSPIIPREALKEARHIAEKFGLELDVIPVHIMDDIRFRTNPVDRCYWCKKKSATLLKWRAAELNFACVADGINLSDTKEHRPGLVAASEEKIAHPFLDAGLTKEDIREIARFSNLDFWNKPSDACLATRIQYGDEITREKLRLVEEAETLLHTSGFAEVRVRVHGKIARIEVPEPDMPSLLAMHRAVTENLRSIGFTYVTLDLGGYRSGSMDEVLGQKRSGP
jgi:uncharacterized protein